MRHPLNALVAASGLALGLTAAQAEAAGPTAVSVSNGYLVDADGMSLYLFEPDEKGASTCYDACAAAWPPLTAEGAPEAGEGAEASLLRTIERKDGAMQVTYGGWPLYTFVKDEKPGDTTGQDVEGFGGEWYLVTPEGEAMED